jgi:hypothetical protein
MYDDDYFLWFKGGNILSVVNVNTFEFEDLDMIKGKYINLKKIGLIIFHRGKLTNCHNLYKRPYKVPNFVSG